MKNLKPSQLPEGSVIDDERYGEYIKRDDGIWEETSCDYMGDRERVTDIGYADFTPKTEWYSRYGLCGRKKSDDYFKDYKIIATPPDFYLNARTLHGDLIGDTGIYLDGTPIHGCKGYNCEA